MAIQLSKTTKAKDVVEKFCKASTKYKAMKQAERLNAGRPNAGSADTEHSRKGKRCPCGDNHFLYEVGGNIGKLEITLLGPD